MSARFCTVSPSGSISSSMNSSDCPRARDENRYAPSRSSVIAFSNRSFAFASASASCLLLSDRLPDSDTTGRVYRVIRRCHERVRLALRGRDRAESPALPVGEALHPVTLLALALLVV